MESLCRGEKTYGATTGEFVQVEEGHGAEDAQDGHGSEEAKQIEVKICNLILKCNKPNVRIGPNHTYCKIYEGESLGELDSPISTALELGEREEGDHGQKQEGGLTGEDPQRVLTAEVQGRDDSKEQLGEMHHDQFECDVSSCQVTKIIEQSEYESSGYQT